MNKLCLWLLILAVAAMCLAALVRVAEAPPYAWEVEEAGVEPEPDVACARVDQ